MLTLGPLLEHTHISNIFGVFRKDCGLPVILAPFYQKGNVLNYNNKAPGADKMRQVSGGNVQFAPHNLIYPLDQAGCGRLVVSTRP